MSANPIGQTLIDQYRVDEFIAAGGMGAVYRVWDIKRNVPLAMKVLHADLSEDPSAAKRFQREANALKDLAHPNIVPFYGLFQSADFSFLLTAFVDGPSLKDLLSRRRNQPLSPAEVLTFLKALSAALGYAHVNGFVHCDVKPGNVMLDQAGNIFLTDFGIARTTTGATTTTLGSAGTPAYMAPEQIRGETLTAAADIYALGVMSFELLTGQRPFRGDEAETQSAGRSTGERIIYAHLNLPAPDPRGLNPSIPPLLAQAVLQALEKDPARRFASARAFYTACAGALGVRPDTVPDRFTMGRKSPEAAEQTLASQPPVAIPYAGAPTQTPIPAETASTQGTRRPTPWLLVGGGILLLAIVFLLGWGAFTIGSHMLSREKVTSTPPVAEEIRVETTQPEESTATPGRIEPTSTRIALAPTATSRIPDEPGAGEIPQDPRDLPKAYKPLPNCASSHLKLGDWGFITFGGGHNDIRSAPDTHSSTNTIGEAQEGELLQIVGGPECNFGWILWEVQTAAGIRGWTPESDGSEFWIIPFPSWQACPSSRPSALRKGEMASVAAFPDVANKVRQAPGRGSDQIGTVMPGEKVEILDGPECVDGYTWWLISSPTSRVTGWTAEGDENSSWLLPFPHPEIGFDSDWHQGKLVFPRDFNDSRALFVLSLSSLSEPELLAAPPSGQRFMGPVWSPDGKRIAFYNQTTKDILLMEAIPGAQQVNVADGTQPTWSPDGSQILYRAGDGIFQVRDAATLKQGARMKVDPNANLPDWSPQADWIAYAIIANDGATSLWQQPLAGGNPSLLNDRSFQNYAPAWSHDGQWLAYQSDENSSKSEIWVMDRSGGNARRLTETPGEAWSRAPTWSPDDRWIAFISNQAGSIGSDYGEVFIIPAEGGDPIQVTFTGGSVYDWRVHWGS